MISIEEVYCNGAQLYRVPGGISKGEESGRTFDKCGKEM